jgi:predicted negative regulator of RcsB-dependent stress response
MSEVDTAALQRAVEALQWASERPSPDMTVEELAVLRLANASIPFGVQEAINLILTGVAVLPKAG